MQAFELGVTATVLPPESLREIIVGKVGEREGIHFCFGCASGQSLARHPGWKARGVRVGERLLHAHIPQTHRNHRYSYGRFQTPFPSQPFYLSIHRPLSGHIFVRLQRELPKYSHRHA